MINVKLCCYYINQDNKEYSIEKNFTHHMILSENECIEADGFEFVIKKVIHKLNKTFTIEECRDNSKNVIYCTYFLKHRIDEELLNSFKSLGWTVTEHVDHF